MPVLIAYPVSTKTNHDNNHEMKTHLWRDFDVTWRSDEKGSYGESQENGRNEKSNKETCAHSIFAICLHINVSTCARPYYIDLTLNNKFSTVDNVGEIPNTCLSIDTHSEKYAIDACTHKKSK